MTLDHAPVVDSHVHLFPSIRRGDGFKQKGRAFLSPVFRSVHKFQPYLRQLPPSLRKVLDEMGALAALPHVFLKSSAEDLLEEMAHNDVDFAVVIAHPPFASNDFILHECAKSDRLIPVVAFPPGTKQPAKSLENFLKKGAKGLKIHAAATGGDLKSSHFTSLLKKAEEHGCPVILHTGNICNHAFYKSPHLGEASLFEPWFEKFSAVRFLLAHMNFHEPEAAIRLAEKYPNVLLDTSWQPTETIIEASRRVGADRVLFASDWPMVGENIEICKARVLSARQSRLLSEEDIHKILGGNARNLWGVN